MSRKDFEAIAKILASYRKFETSAPIGSTAAAIAIDLAKVLETSNARFDRARFFNAVEAK